MNTPFEIAGPAGPIAGITAGPDDGTGLPVLLVHGINMSRDVWSEMAETLSRSRRVVVPDLRGHGRSTRSGPFGADDYAGDLLAVMDALGVRRAHVVGTSFGGSVACALAVRAPERVASITAIGSALAVEGLDLDGAVAALRSLGPGAFFSGFLPQASFAPGTDPRLIERALDAATSGRDVDTVIAVSTTALTSDLRELASKVRAPALVISGEIDATCPVPAGKAMAEALGARFEVVPDRGHVLTMEDPKAVLLLLIPHLEANEESR